MVVDGQTDFLELLLGGKTANNPLNTDGELQFFVPRERDSADQQLDFELNDDIQIDDFLTDLTSSKLIDDTGIPQATVIIEDMFDPNLSAQVPTSSSTASSYDDSNIFQFDFNDNQHQRTLSESTDADSVYSYLECSTPFSPTSPYSLPPATPESASSSGSSAKDLIKASLKMKVKNKRKMEGKEDIKIEFVAPPPEKLSEEELEQRRIKREKNKLAAQKCRGKKRERADVLEAHTKVLLAEQEESKMEIQKLIDERDRLRDIITIHGAFCPAMMAEYNAA